MDWDEAADRYQRATELLRIKEYGAALPLLEQLDDAFPKQRRYMYKRALCLAKVGRYEESLELCDEILDLFQYDLADQLKQLIYQEQSRRQAAPAPPAQQNEAPPGVPDEVPPTHVVGQEVGAGAPPTVPLQDASDEPATDFQSLGLDWDDDLGGASAQPAPVMEKQPSGAPKAILGIVALLLVGGIAAGGFVMASNPDLLERVMGSSADGSGENSDTTTAAAPAAESGVESADSGMGPIDLDREMEMVKTQTSSSQGGVTANVSVEYGVWTNCGGYDNFLAKFRNCEPAAIRMQAMGNMVIEFRVMGMEGGQCRLEVRFVENPMFADWNGKSMVCPCDNSGGFIAETQKMAEAAMPGSTLVCEGPLYDVMKATMAQYQQ